MRRRLIISGLLALTMLMPSPALAEESTETEAEDGGAARLSLRPVDSDRSFFDLEMEPGEARELTVELENTGEDTGTGDFYAAEAYTRVNGGFGGRMKDDPVSGVTEWLTLDPVRVELGAEEAVERTLEVAVPEDVESGEYISALVFENSEITPLSEGSGLRLNQRNRSLISVFIDVPGPRRPEVAIGDVFYQPGNNSSSVAFEVENLGNERLNLDGEFRLEDDFENLLLERDVEMKVFYAGHKTRLEVGLGEQLEPGGYWVWLSLDDSERNVSDRVERMYLNVPEPEAESQEGDTGIAGLIQPPRMPGDDGSGSWLTLAGLIAAVSLLAALVGVLLGRRRHAGAGSAPTAAAHPEPEPDPVAQPSVAGGSGPVEQEATARVPETGPRKLKPLTPNRGTD